MTTPIQTRQTRAQKRAEERRNALPAAAAAVRQVQRLYVVRESTAYKWELFAAMMLQVLGRHAARPAVATILGHGVTLMQPSAAGQDLRHELRAVAVRRPRRGRGRPGRALAYLIIIDEDAFLLSQMSASRPNDDGTNDFGIALADVIRELRPEELHTGPASRFGRSTEVFARVANEVKAVGCRVFSDEAPEGLNLANPNDALRWDMYGLIAAAEAREILKRLTIGRLIDAQEGRWPFGPRHTVLGYECEGDKMPRVSSDPQVLGWVRLLIELGADPALSDEDIVARLAAEGLTTPKLQDLYGYGDDEDSDGEDGGDGPQFGLRAALHPEKVVQRLYSHLETYGSGIFRFELTCPVPGITEWCSTPVYREEGDQYGVFRIDIPLGLPEGGWADPATMERAIQLRCGPREAAPTGGAGHGTDHKPFSGFDSWRQDGRDWLFSAKDPSYHVLVRDVVHAGHNWHEGSHPGEAIAALNPGEFHTNVADRILAVLDEQGFDAASVVFTSRPSADAPVKFTAGTDHWKREIEKLKTTNKGLAQALGSALGNGDTDSAGLFQGNINENNGRIAEYEALVRTASTPAPPPVMQTADVTGLPELLKLLKLGHAQYPGIVSRRLHRLVHGLRFEVDPFTVRWSCQLRVPTDVGMAYIPVSGQVHNVIRARGKHRAAVAKARADYLAKLWIDDGLDIPSIAEATLLTDPDTVERRLRRDVLAHWPITEAMATAVIHCPFPGPREVLHRMHRNPRVASPYAQTVLDAYATIKNWREGWNSDVDGDRQRVIDVLWSAGSGDADLLERGLLVTDLALLAEVDHRKISEVMAVEPHDRGGRLKAPLYGRVLEKDRWTRATPATDRRIRLRRCPWCGTRTVTIVCRAPELGAWPVLCHSCMRRPDDPAGVVFTSEYDRRHDAGDVMSQARND